MEQSLWIWVPLEGNFFILKPLVQAWHVKESFLSFKDQILTIKGSFFAKSFSFSVHTRKFSSKKHEKKIFIFFSMFMVLFSGPGPVHVGMYICIKICDNRKTVSNKKISSIIKYTTTRKENSNSKHKPSQKEK